MDVVEARGPARQASQGGVCEAVMLSLGLAHSTSGVGVTGQVDHPLSADPAVEGDRRVAGRHQRAAGWEQGSIG